jgi:hypothetical protein
VKMLGVGQNVALVGLLDMTGHPEHRARGDSVSAGPRSTKLRQTAEAPSARLAVAPECQHAEVTASLDRHQETLTAAAGPRSHRS